MNSGILLTWLVVSTRSRFLSEFCRFLVGFTVDGKTKIKKKPIKREESEPKNCREIKPANDVDADTLL